MEGVERILMLWNLFVARWDAYEKQAPCTHRSGLVYDIDRARFNEADAEFMGHFNAWLRDRKAAQESQMGPMDLVGKLGRRYNNTETYSDPPWGSEETK